MTQMGIELAAFRLVAHCLSQLRHRAPPTITVHQLHNGNDDDDENHLVPYKPTGI